MEKRGENEDGDRERERERETGRERELVLGLDGRGELGNIKNGSETQDKEEVGIRKEHPITSILSPSKVNKKK